MPLPSSIDLLLDLLDGLLIVLKIFKGAMIHSVNIINLATNFTRQRLLRITTRTINY